MAITQPTVDDFSDTTVMRVIRRVVNYLVTLIPKVNEEIANVTDNAGQRLDSVEDNIEALNKELPTEIRIDYDASTGNFNIDYVKEDGDILTSNTVVIVSGSTGEVTIVQNTSGISINGTALQSATTAQPGLMTPALVSSLNNVNDTTNDHTTMLNAQAEAITALDDRVDALEQVGGGGEVWEEIDLTNIPTDFVAGDRIKVIFNVSGSVSTSGSSWDATISNGTLKFGSTSGTKYYSDVKEFLIGTEPIYHGSLIRIVVDTYYLGFITTVSPTVANINSGTLFNIDFSAVNGNSRTVAGGYITKTSNIAGIYKMWRLKK